jgi:hypothetical protein
LPSTQYHRNGEINASRIGIFVSMKTQKEYFGHGIKFEPEYHE